MAIQPDQTAEFIARQLWRYIEDQYGGDVAAFAADVEQDATTVYNYTGKKRKPGWEILAKWFARGMSPLYMFLDIGPQRWNPADADATRALLGRIQGAQEAIRTAERLLEEAKEYA